MCARARVYSADDDDATLDEEEDDDYIAECLTNPSPVEYVLPLSHLIVTRLYNSASREIHSITQPRSSPRSLTYPRPHTRRYYGTKRLWPSAVDVEYAGDVFCGDDKHCSGSYCDFQHIPPKCAPKATKHFKHDASRYYSDSFADPASLVQNYNDVHGDL